MECFGNLFQKSENPVIIQSKFCDGAYFVESTDALAIGSEFDHFTAFRNSVRPTLIECQLDLELFDAQFPILYNCHQSDGSPIYVETTKSGISIHTDDENMAMTINGITFAVADEETPSKGEIRVPHLPQFKFNDTTSFRRSVYEGIREMLGLLDTSSPFSGPYREAPGHDTYVRDNLHLLQTLKQYAHRGLQEGLKT